MTEAQYEYLKKELEDLKKRKQSTEEYDSLVEFLEKLLDLL